MAQFIFYYRNMNIGGCQLLIMNFTKELISRGDRVLILCEFVDDLIEKDNPNVNIRSLGHDNWYSDKEIKKILNTFTNAKIITFTWEDFSRVYSLNRSKNKILFYAVHCDMIKFSAYSENRLLRYIRKWFIKPVIRNLLIHNIIAVMDKQTILHSEDYYDIDFSNAYIIHIPVNNSGDIVEVSEIDRFVENSNKNILAIARADFPFKGYLLGLVNALKNNIIPKDYSLTIVTYGKDKEKLVNLINTLDVSEKKRVKLLGETPYSELRQLFQKASLYVGMGTTLLDASKYGVISIPVVPYTDDVLCEKYFHETPEWVALDNGHTENLCRLIKKYEEMSNIEKKTCIMKCIDIVKNMYSLEKCTDRFKNIYGIMEDYHSIRINISYKCRNIKRIIQNKIGARE